MDPNEFLLALARPPEDPTSIHPALLNALYLATCWIVGGELKALKGYFADQTRLHLERSLEAADRLTHFLWASVVLGSFFALEGRLNEAYVTVSSCAKFALACGLDVVHFRNSGRFNQTPLLAPPSNDEELRDRMRLSHAIYIMDRTLAMVSGFPSVFASPTIVKEPSETGWSEMSSRVHSMQHEHFSVMSRVCTELVIDSSITSTKSLKQDLHQELDELCIEELPHNLKAIVLYEKIEQLARRAECTFQRFFGVLHPQILPFPLTVLSPNELDVQISVLSQALTTHGVFLPSLLDSWGLEPFESVSRLNPMMIFGHVNYHGCVMLLHSLTAKKNPNSRAKVVGAARALAELCPQIRGEKGIRRVHGSLLLIVRCIEFARFPRSC